MGQLDRTTAGAGVGSQTEVRGRSVGRVLARVVVVLVLLAVVGYLAVGAYVASVLTHPHRNPQVSSPAAFGLTSQDVQVQARDGVQLAGWLIPAQTQQRAVLLVHGIHSCRSCEFDGLFLQLAQGLNRQGYAVLLIDLRGHGASGGDRFSLGDQERLDVEGAVDWLRQQGYARVGILGVSMGGASTVEALADPNGVTADAVVLDSVFGDAPGVLAGQFPRESGLPNAFLPGSLFMGKVLYHADLASVRPVDDLPSLKAPVMLIYGLRDDLVPPYQIQAMQAARPDATRWVVPDVGHADIYGAYPQEYTTRVVSFLDQTMK